MDDKLDDLRQRREQAYNAGSQRAVERQHEKGKMLARERIEYLLDPGSFQELDLLDGKTLGHAMRAARGSLWRSRRTFGSLWAAYQHYGDPNAVLRVEP